MLQNHFGSFQAGVYFGFGFTAVFGAVSGIEGAVLGACVQDGGWGEENWVIEFKYAYYRIGELLHLPLNQERLRKLTENYVVSNAKIKEALGIKRMPVSAKEGLRRTIKAFLK